MESAQGGTNAVVLALGNTYEFNERYNSALPVAQLARRRKARESFAVSGDLALFWGGPINNRVVVTPERTSTAYLRYVREHLGLLITPLTPRLKTGWVCRDLLTDTATRDSLLGILEGKDVYVAAWGATEYYYMVLAFLREHGIRIVHHDFPASNDHWVVDYCDSKSGARTFIQHLNIPGSTSTVTPGFICHDLSEAAGLSSFLFYHREVPVIIKSDWGDAGKTVHLLHGPRHNQPFSSIWNGFMAEIQGNSLWRDALIVVEEAVGGGRDLTTPSVDCLIDDLGKVTVLGLQNMLTVNNKCVGFEMGKGVLSRTLESRLTKIVEIIGQQMSIMGYRGWFDVDFLLPDDGKGLFVSEINPRRTGGASPLEFAVRRLGNNWTKDYYLRTFERFELPHPVGPMSIMKIAARLNATHVTSSAEILPLLTKGASLSHPYLGYAIYARTKTEALGLEAEFVEQLSRPAQSVNAKRKVSLVSAAHTSSG